MQSGFKFVARGKNKKKPRPRHASFAQFLRVVCFLWTPPPPQSLLGFPFFFFFFTPPLIEWRTFPNTLFWWPFFVFFFFGFKFQRSNFFFLDLVTPFFKNSRGKRRKKKKKKKRGLSRPSPSRTPFFFFYAGTTSSSSCLLSSIRSAATWSPRSLNPRFSFNTSGDSAFTTAYCHT